jgi:hypothetical protein
MTDNLQTALEFSNKMLSLKIQKQFLKEKFDADITFGYNGGLFKITPDLLMFIKYLLDHDKTHNVTMIDFNGNPIVISDLSYFHSLTQDKYFSALGFYQAGYTDLKNKRRNIKK